jgi:hypothetical protein
MQQKLSRAFRDGCDSDNVGSVVKAFHEWKRSARARVGYGLVQRTSDLDEFEP